ncbi:MAG: class II aldolase/adducin family protein [Promethearchaeota archaeon]
MTNEKYLSLRKRIVEIEKKLLEKGFVVGPAGNVSARTPEEDKILITPSGITHDRISPEDILLVDFKGDILDGELLPSSELEMHLSIYRTQEDAGAVIHSHPAFSTSLAVVGKTIPPLLDEFVVFVGEEVKLAEYAVAGSEELADNVIAAIGDSRAVLLSNHGLLCYGKDLDDALFVTELVEETAKVLVHALAIGTPKRLPRAIVERQKEIFEMIKFRDKQ